MNRSPIVNFTLIFFFWLTLLSVCSAQSKHHQCVQKYLANLQRIQSLEYHGQIVGRVENTPEGVQRVHRRHFKAMDGFRYLEIEHFREDLPAGIDRNHETICFGPGKLESYNHLNRTVEISTTQADPKTNSKIHYHTFDFFLHAIGWIPEKKSFFQQYQKDHRFPICHIKHGNLKHVEPNCLLNGGKCTKLAFQYEESSLEVWFSAEKNGWPIRMVQTVSAGKSSWKVRYEFQSFVTVDSIQLPTVIRRSHSNMERYGERLFSDLEIKSLKINHLKKSDFQIEKLPGLVTQNFETKQIRAAPGGFDLLDKTLRFGKHFIRQEANDGSRIDVKLLPILFATIGIGTLAVGLYIQLRLSS